MGFSGGSSNVTKAHTHDSTIVQDGGSLAANVTQFGLSAGSILYSDGSNIQELAVGSASDALVVNGAATAPEWGSGGGAGGNMVFLERFTTSAASSKTCTFSTPVVLADFVKIVGIWNGKYHAGTGTAGLELTVITNNETIDAGYNWSANVLSATTSTLVAGADTDNFTIGPDTTNAGSRGRVDFDLSHLSVPAAQNNEIYVSWWQIGTNVVQSRGSGFTYDNSGSAITSINGFVFTNGAGQNLESGSTIDFYKITG